MNSWEQVGTFAQDKFHRVTPAKNYARLLWFPTKALFLHGNLYITNWCKVFSLIYARRVYKVIPQYFARFLFAQSCLQLITFQLYNVFNPLSTRSTGEFEDPGEFSIFNYSAPHTNSDMYRKSEKRFESNNREIRILEYRKSVPKYFQIFWSSKICSETLSGQ